MFKFGQVFKLFLAIYNSFCDGIFLMKYGKTQLQYVTSIEQVVENDKRQGVKQNIKSNKENLKK